MKKNVCIDSIPGTNSYNVTLVTVLVVDEFGEGHPVNWCLSNHEDFFVLEQFFKAIKRRIVSITPTWFMSYHDERFCLEISFWPCKEYM